MKKEELTIFVVDDEEVMHVVIKSMLERLNLETQLVSYHSAEEFLASYSPHQPGCLLLDNWMPDMKGIELHEHLIQCRCTMPIIMMTSAADVSLAVSQMKKGLFDFVEKPFSIEQFEQILRRVFQHLLEQQQREDRQQHVHAQFANLTPREQVVMRKMVEGKLNKIIADELQITIKTVEKHRANVMQKMQVRNLPELVRMAIQCGLISIHND